MDNRSNRRFDGQREAVHQAVGHANAFDTKRRDVPRHPGGDFVHVRRVFQVMLCEFVGQESECQAGAEDRHVEVLQNIRQRADMVLVRVSEHDGFELVSSLQQIADVRDDQIDAQKIGASGNMRPQSTAMAASPYSISIMLRPNSPRPPSGMIFTGSIVILNSLFIQSAIRDRAVAAFDSPVRFG